MSEEIRVHVVKYPDRDNLVMRCIDPYTGKPVARSTGTTKHSEAVKVAAKWEAELQEGRYAKRSRMNWQDFRNYYVANALPALSPASVPTYVATLNVFQRTANPQKLSDVSTQRVTAFVTALRTKGLAEASIARHLRHLKAAMRWAHREGLLSVLPVFNMPKRVKGGKVMRGRAITAEEFERMLAATPKVVENAAAASWKFYLQGLWLSGLRLSESLTLRWDRAPNAIVVDFSHRHPMFLVSSESEKGKQDRVLPMAPEFAQLLETVPKRERRGRVFKLLATNGKLLQATRTAVGKTVTRIGESAGVVVDEKMKGGEVVKKFASAHDFRRAFGFRWSRRVMPTVLRELMRHAEIGTTMRYYVGSDAEATADELWKAVGNISGNTQQSAKISDEKQSSQNVKD